MSLEASKAESRRKWRYAYASAAGTSHARTGLQCQDSCLCTELYLRDGSSLIVALAADGAGTAQKAGLGSSLAISFFNEALTEHFSTGGLIEDVSRDLVVKLIKQLQAFLLTQAEAERIDLRHFATTLLVAIIGDDSSVFFQIGDGAIVVSDREQPDDYSWVFWPQQGQYVNQTHFVTDEDVLENIDYAYVTQAIDDVAMFTDGIQTIALHFQTQTAHAPFFKAMFKPLRVNKAGYLQDLSSSLAAYLDSAAVNQRTDDDKSLVLISRR